MSLREWQQRLLDLAQEQHEAWMDALQAMEAENNCEAGLSLSALVCTSVPKPLEEEPTQSPWELLSPRNESAPSLEVGSLSVVHALSVPESPGRLSNSRRSSQSTGVQSLMAGKPPSHHLEDRMDKLSAIMVMVNCVTMLLELEMEGRIIGVNIGMVSANENALAGASLPVLQYIDLGLLFFFLVETLVRLSLQHLQFFTDLANIFDLFLVVSGIVDASASGLLSPHSSGSSGWRLVRALKALRAFRMVRSFRLFRGLRVLVQACQCFLPSLFWSMFMLGIFMIIGALLMGNLLQGFLEEPEGLLEDRQWIWLRYGTAHTAAYTLFEITFAGNWPTNVRPVLEKVSQSFILFFASYIAIVVFAVIRVISAVFLRDTLEAAQSDAEHMVTERLQKKAQDVEKLEGVFRDIDESGEGLITEDVLNRVLANPKVRAYFQTLGLDVHEGTALFHLLDNGDGEVTLDEFIGGIMRCRGPARAIDQVALQADFKKLDLKLVKIMHHLEMREETLSQASQERQMRRAESVRIFSFDASVELGRAW
ncbi:unnamed protein product [Effrenium voratum]|uniref:Ion transport domain-containing protein n=1 Tax=Effrenium voratum TaxID=2562239 RepID=A0AA36N7R6_9DINO|nr:unnamed protein product [Effrenium voratum]